MKLLKLLIMKIFSFRPFLHSKAVYLYSIKSETSKSPILAGLRNLDYYNIIAALD